MPLPVDAHAPGIVAGLAGKTSAVVTAAPGAGKTTRLPVALAGASWLDPGDCIVVLQPRRAAARAAAARVAEEQGWRVGAEVGYHVRFDNRTTPRTRLRFLTEGILARRLQDDPAIAGVGCVVLDEFHERSLHTDLAIALLREVQEALRPGLRIVVMSATMEPGPVAEYLGGAPVTEVPGRLFPVEIEYQPTRRTDPVWDQAAEAVRMASGRDGGHTLVFLPGMREILRTRERIEGHVGDAWIGVLHSSVPADEQDRVLRPSDRRKVILSTNIAETSLTIDGVTTVIDSGWERIPVCDARLGIERLETRRISKAGARQRAGRAGRTAPGTCCRLWTRAEEEAFDDTLLPDVLRADLAQALLALHAYGVSDPGAFQWFEAPPAGNVERAARLLAMLGAVSGGRLTRRGRQLASMPLHPRLGALALSAAERGAGGEGALLAALLSESDFGFDRNRDGDWTTDADVLDQLDALRARRYGDVTTRKRIEQAARDIGRVSRRARG